MAAALCKRHQARAVATSQDAFRAARNALFPLRRFSIFAVLALVWPLLTHAGTPADHAAGSAERFSGAKALAYTEQFVNQTGPRYNGSPGLAKAQAFLKHAFAHDTLEDDAFTSSTPAGPQQMHNYIVRFAGKKDGVIVLATHYETNYWLRDVNFVGANDGGATTGLLLEMANHLRGHAGQLLDGYSVWLVFFDGEESITPQWSNTDSLYGSRHLAAKWAADGTLKRVKAFLLTDMIGDKDLNIDRDTYSTPWLLDLVKQAADDQGYGRYFFAKPNTVEDDHKPFAQRGVPCADIIDIDYGPASDPGGPGTFHHTIKDTLDKISAKSLTISGSTLLEAIHLLDQR